MPPAPPPHPDLGRLADLLGDWHGDGHGQWAGGDPFHYREWVTFTHNGKPFLIYSQRTQADDGRLLHAESGYWRAVDGGRVEVAMTHPIGVVEIELGSWQGDRLILRTGGIEVTPTAKPVTGLQRDVEIGGDILRYTLRMATDGGATRPHLRAELRRVAPSSTDADEGRSA